MNTATPATVTLDNGQTFRLGRIRPKARCMAPRLAAYFDPDLMTSPPPASLDYAAKAMDAIKRVYLNDQYGDCVIAGKMHSIGVWTGNDAGQAVQATDGEVLSQYHSICGPGDNGCNIEEVLNYFKARGLTVAGQNHKIDGYVAVDWTNKLEVQVALYLFGPLTLGINLPGAWGGGRDGDTWDVTNTRFVGGHDVCTYGYDEKGVGILTWGGRRTITWAAFTSKKWIEECWALLSPDWYGSDKLAPCGVDAATLKADMEKIGGGTIPPIDPNPVPIDWFV